MPHLASLPRHIQSRIAYHTVLDAPNAHPAALLPLLLACRTLNHNLTFAHNPQLYHELYLATFDSTAITRRYEWMLTHIFTRGVKGYNLFSDPRPWAIDYRTRWELCGRWREVAKLGTIDIPGLCGYARFAEDLWDVFFLLSENDGKNLVFVTQMCRLQEVLNARFQRELAKESLAPGYPRMTWDRSLLTWIGLLGDDHVGEAESAEVDEKIFMLRPYIFAAAQYGIGFGPWNQTKLPLCQPGCTKHSASPANSHAVTYKRFGYAWRRSPPDFITGIYILFFRLLERHSDRAGTRQGNTSFTHNSKQQQGGVFSGNGLPLSEMQDLEWQRDTMCQDPHTSQGLPALALRGKVQGYWRGKFLFYDYELYREMTEGNMRRVYTGMFADQAVEMELKEIVVKVREEDVGGDGPMIGAGFKDLDDVDEEVKAVEEGYGHEIVGDDEPVPEGWTKEILIAGRGRDAWGWCRIRGRVRSWDGLVILCLTYARVPGTTWLWRGYTLPGGYLTGRWHDTFTNSTDSKSYEGPFSFIRAGDPCYPPHFPLRLQESLGVDTFGGGMPSAPIPIAIPSEGPGGSKPWHAQYPPYPNMDVEAVPKRHAVAQVEDADRGKEETTSIISPGKPENQDNSTVPHVTSGVVVSAEDS
ncbi:hypothetical protein I350_02828 [Cryptococcus amylolentus CBS 6273]|uniref:F-box domain-containing protein n=1 Tax=Cryptococcus amylolentus CBS 6273 TaxID=1296118 RepID=A0A1E3K7P8_9TREE|nr:hypothetical protein I350_02828 [Cryptococcus amylolentus CBS 6273]